MFSSLTSVRVARRFFALMYGCPPFSISSILALVISIFEMLIAGPFFDFGVDAFSVFMGFGWSLLGAVFFFFFASISACKSAGSGGVCQLSSFCWVRINFGLSTTTF